MRSDAFMPTSYHLNLATWNTINALYAQKTQLALQNMRYDIVDATGIDRLFGLIEQRAGHWLAMQVEESKIALSEQDARPIDLSRVVVNTTFGFGGLADVVEGEPQVIAGIRVAGGQFEGPAIVGDGLGVALLGKELVAGTVELLRVRVRWGRGGRPASEHLALDEGRRCRLGRRVARRGGRGQTPGWLAQIVVAGQGEDGEAIEGHEDRENEPLQGCQSGHGVPVFSIVLGSDRVA
jgi:hypothetical protein